MLDQLLKQLQTKVKTTGTLPEETRDELLKQAALLESQQTKDDEEEEAENPDLREGVNRLIASIEGLEASHPEITSLVNRIAMTLGNMGI